MIMHKCNYMYMYNYYLALHSGGGKGRSAESGDDLWCCGRGRLREGENRRCCAVRWQAKGTLWMRAKGGRAGVERKGYGGRLAAAVTSSFMNSLYFCSVQNKTYVPVEKNEKKNKERLFRLVFFIRPFVFSSVRVFSKPRWSLG